MLVQCWATVCDADPPSKQHGSDDRRTLRCQAAIVDLSFIAGQQGVRAGGRRIYDKKYGCSEATKYLLDGRDQPLKTDQWNLMRCLDFCSQRSHETTLIQRCFVVGQNNKITLDQSLVFSWGKVRFTLPRGGHACHDDDTSALRKSQGCELSHNHECHRYVNRPSFKWLQKQRNKQGFKQDLNQIRLHRNE